MSKEWPETVPILTERFICRGVLNGSGGRSCLRGWVYKAFGEDIETSDHPALVADRALRDEIGTYDLPGWNDDKRTTKKEIAKVWNLTMRKLGYTVPAGTYKGPK